MKDFNDIYVNATYAAEHYAMASSMTHNDFGLTCDENGLIFDGPFKGKYLDPNACIGDEDFRNMEKRMETIRTFWVFGTLLAMILLVIIMIKLKNSSFNPYIHCGIFIVIAISYTIIDNIFNHIQYNEILKNARTYKAVLYKVGTKREGKGAVKECYFAILDKDRVRVIKEFIRHQAINRYADFKKDEGLIGYEFMVMASPDTSGYCIRSTK